MDGPHLCLKYRCLSSGFERLRTGISAANKRVTDLAHHTDRKVSVPAAPSVPLPKVSPLSDDESMGELTPSAKSQDEVGFSL
jgi:hypothetical protein